MEKIKARLAQADGILNAIAHSQYDALNDQHALITNPSLKKIGDKCFQRWAYIDIALYQGDSKMITLIHSKSSVPLYNCTKRYQTTCKILLETDKLKPIYYSLSMFKEDNLSAALKALSLDQAEEASLEPINTLFNKQKEMIATNNSEDILAALEDHTWVISIAALISNAALTKSLSSNKHFLTYSENFKHEQQLQADYAKKEASSHKQDTVLNKYFSKIILCLAIAFLMRRGYTYFTRESFTGLPNHA